MPFKIEDNEDRDYIESPFTGRFTMTMARQCIQELIPILEETKCNRVPSDSSNAQILVSSSDILQFPEMVAASPRAAQLKRAAVAAPGSSGYSMYETLSKIQGQNIRVFTDRTEALRWLLSNEE